MALSDTPTIGLGRLLSEGTKFYVPHHQREYSWSEDKIDQLLSDILFAQNDEQEEYFLGLMVFMAGKSDTEYSILDGQQRLATTEIILSSVRSWLKGHGNDEDSEKIQNEFIGMREYGETEIKPRLVLNANNNANFYDYVVSERPLEEIQGELDKTSKFNLNYDLLNAIVFCREKITELAGKVSSDIAKQSSFLFDIVKYLRDKVRIVRLTVSNETNAFRVFETLNDRGLDLSSLDLIKNHLFSYATERIKLQTIQRRWTEMMNTLSNTSSDDFLKVYWTSRNGRVQVEKIFPSLKSKVTGWPAADKLSSDMQLSSEQYVGLLVPDDPIWSGFSKEHRSRIADLGTLSAKQILPAMLAALDIFPREECEKLTKLLEVLIVRYQLIVGGRTGLLEIACARLAKKIYDKDISKAAKAAKALSDIMPTDVAFMDAFRNKQERTSKKASYLLRHLEMEMRTSPKSGETELEPGKSLTLEHILPKNPNQDWAFLKDDKDRRIEDYKYRIGNQCLLLGVNKSLGSKGFAEKRGYYGKSKLLSTKMVSKSNIWDYAAIEKRQAALAEIAAKHWKY